MDLQGIEDTNFKDFVSQNTQALLEPGILQTLDSETQVNVLNTVVFDNEYVLEAVLNNTDLQVLRQVSLNLSGNVEMNEKMFQKILVKKPGNYLNLILPDAFAYSERIELLGEVERDNVEVFLQNGEALKVACSYAGARIETLDMFAQNFPQMFIKAVEDNLFYIYSKSFNRFLNGGLGNLEGFTDIEGTGVETKGLQTLAQYPTWTKALRKAFIDNEETRIRTTVSFEKTREDAGHILGWQVSGVEFTNIEAPEGHVFLYGTGWSGRRQQSGSVIAVDVETLMAEHKDKVLNSLGNMYLTDVPTALTSIPNHPEILNEVALLLIEQENRDLLDFLYNPQTLSKTVQLPLETLKKLFDLKPDETCQNMPLYSSVNHPEKFSEYVEENFNGILENLRYAKNVNLLQAWYESNPDGALKKVLEKPEEMLITCGNMVAKHHVGYFNMLVEKYPAHALKNYPDVVAEKYPNPSKIFRAVAGMNLNSVNKLYLNFSPDSYLVGYVSKNPELYATYCYSETVDALKNFKGGSKPLEYMLKSSFAKDYVEQNVLKNWQIHLPSEIDEDTLNLLDDGVNSGFFGQETTKTYSSEVSSEALDFYCGRYPKHVFNWLSQQINLQEGQVVMGGSGFRLREKSERSFYSNRNSKTSELMQVKSTNGTVNRTVNRVVRSLIKTNPGFMAEKILVEPYWEENSGWDEKKPNFVSRKLIKNEVNDALKQELLEKSKEIKPQNAKTKNMPETLNTIENTLLKRIDVVVGQYVQVLENPLAYISAGKTQILDSSTPEFKTLEETLVKITDVVKSFHDMGNQNVDTRNLEPLVLQAEEALRQYQDVDEKTVDARKILRHMMDTLDAYRSNPVGEDLETLEIEFMKTLSTLSTLEKRTDLTDSEIVDVQKQKLEKTVKSYLVKTGAYSSINILRNGFKDAALETSEKRMTGLMKELEPVKIRTAGRSNEATLKH